ncbi:MAG: hypothetical protein QNJ42_09200 [Crocosphaera sp.]|nr:hypothetical protein [Crocosphaera sp.]
MKVLLDVIKTLLLINGAIVLPSFLLVMALYEQRSTNMATADHVSSKFHRNIQDDTPTYKQKLEQLADEKNKLQAKLEASQRTQAVIPVSSNSPSAQNTASPVGPVAPSPTVTAPFKSTVKAPGLAKVTMVSQTQSQPKPSQQSVTKASVSPPRETEISISNDKSLSKPDSAVNIAANSSKTDELSAGHNSSEQEIGTSRPEGFISPEDLNKKAQKQTRPFIHSIIASQDKSPMDLSKDLAAGLIVAGNRDELSHSSTKYKKVQTAIRSLRKGSSQTLEEAASRASIDLKTLQWVAYYGQTRPGGIQISRANLR